MASMNYLSQLTDDEAREFRRAMKSGADKAQAQARDNGSIDVRFACQMIERELRALWRDGIKRT